VKLLCLGDVAIGKDTSVSCRWEPPGNIKPGSDEKIIFNWELPIGKRLRAGAPSTHPRLSVSADTPRIIENWSPGFATLATNHMLDAGSHGIKTTIEELNLIGMETTGAGYSEEYMSKPIFWETGDGRLCLLNWVFPETNPDWMLVPGVNCWPGVESAKSIIHELKRQSDWIVVFVHWSDELFYYPRPQDREIADELAKMGADVIIGHHPHVVRGAEVSGHCPIFYSLGNFYFSDFQDLQGRWLKQAPLNRESLGVILTFRNGKMREYETVSFIQTKTGALPDPYKRAEINLQKLSRPLHRLSHEDYKIWYGKRKAYFLKWDAKWQFGFRKLGILGTLEYLKK
jgi:hypothetical protein